ncbi:DsbE family thiol:disulfide interchange protein [Legionella waltersii]|uniref:Cytochrome C biogenesis protein n=1 Tax=Legionella waltersii TaxID=66969 RepID=A0A0W1ANF1_9GAMM|nr:DsbE family thiol:disulfide interchange protein [Legionella waltersii]KTD82847.1 cytochrome C biogenesis protein [Legionella waltersii]SNV01747.1 cytochrome c biogenesis protein CcmG, thiol-disulfide interchange protein DsbE [Legionella waltersii]
MKRFGWRSVPVLLFLLLCLFLWRGLFLNPHYLPSVQLGKQLPLFNLPQLDKPKVTFSNAELSNNVLLLNVWASWCQACVEEQVLLMQLARQGVPIYGLNYKDDPQQALQWLSQWGNPYRMIGQDKYGKLAIDLGVYGAPETFVIDKKGVIRYRQVGIMTQEIWDKDIRPLMQELEKVVS